MQLFAASTLLDGFCCQQFSALSHCTHNNAHITHFALSAVKMDRLATILTNLRRRDNIRNFISGLEDSECWPYPDGETQSIPPVTQYCVCCGEPSVDEVMLREDKIGELTHIFPTNVYRRHAFAPSNRGRKHQAALTDVSIELCPEEGPGAYAVSYEVVDEVQRRGAPCLDPRDVATIRSAFMHRYEWVINKLHSVEEDRRDALEMTSEVEAIPVLGDAIESENEEPLSEEEDHDARQPDSDCSVSAHTSRPPRLTPQRS